MKNNFSSFIYTTILRNFQVLKLVNKHLIQRCFFISRYSAHAHPKSAPMHIDAFLALRKFAGGTPDENSLPRCKSLLLRARYCGKKRRELKMHRATKGASCEEVTRRRGSFLERNFPRTGDLNTSSGASSMLANDQALYTRREMCSRELGGRALLSVTRN